MATVDTYFATSVYRARIGGRGSKDLLTRLAACADALSVDDTAGQRWCEANAYPGYTSYGSLNDLPWRFPEFADLAGRIEPHVAAFASDLAFDLNGRQLVLDSLWVNTLDPDGHHSAHIHPHSVISGTFYVSVPKGAGSIRFEDPRLGMMMAAPPRLATAPMSQRQFVTIAPKAGDLLLWESWLRHEVPINDSDETRVSVSFNYALGSVDEAGDMPDDADA